MVAMDIARFGMSTRARIRSYRDLVVWQRGMTLVRETYELTLTFPRDERFGLTAQLRRATVSVPANIAEGHGRVHLGDYIHHLSIAQGSLCEIETLLLLSIELRLTPAHRVAPLLETCREVGRLLGGLIRALRVKSNSEKGTERSRARSQGAVLPGTRPQTPGTLPEVPVT